MSKELQYEPIQNDDYLEFVKTMEQHEILEFDAKKDKIIYYFGGLEDFLLYHYNNDVLEKLQLLNYKNRFAPCAIIHPSVFMFICGNANGISIHKLSDEKRTDIANILGIQPKKFLNTPIVLIKANINGEYNPIDIIHEATHIAQTKKDTPNFTDELKAFLHEIMVFQLTISKDFNEYLNFKKQPNKEFIKLTQPLWDLVITKDFFEIEIEDKINWINQLLQNNPPKNPAE